MKILLVEDELRLAAIVARALKENGYAVDIASSGAEALQQFSLNEYDLIVLDLLLPGIKGGGFAVCTAVRAVNQHIPILILTALDAAADRVKGLDGGADDYLVKPFHIAELLARVRALLRRAPQADPVLLILGELTLNTATRLAYRQEAEIRLSAKEYAVLEYLMKHPGRVINQTELIEHVWDSNYQGLSNVVETYIRYLRKKLSPTGEPNIILTKRGLGYVIEAA